MISTRELISFPLLRSQERICDLFRSVDWAEQGYCWATKDGQAQGSCARLRFQILFLYLVQNQVQQLVVPFQYTSNFTSTCELDSYLLVHVFREIENGFTFWFIHRRLRALRSSALFPERWLLVHSSTSKCSGCSAASLRKVHVSFFCLFTVALVSCKNRCMDCDEKTHTRSAIVPGLSKKWLLRKKIRESCDQL
jgi:hypothetical protein